MTRFKQAISIGIQLSEHGDALFFGTVNDRNFVSGLSLKHHLFAWHEESYYGTELEISQIQDIEIVLLPAEQVIPFLANCELLRHIDWTWQPQAQPLRQIAPLLAVCLEEKAYIPSYTAAKSGKLAWEWDLSATAQAELDAINFDEIDPDFKDRVRAAFSASVFYRYYGTQEAAADLRRDYPLLFSKERMSAGSDEQSWLIDIGWKPDTSPFRPLLQLLEPGMEPETESETEFDPSADEDWRLQLVLQDKLNPALLVPIRLGTDGRCFGTWPETWSEYVRSRSANWLDRLQACLPEAYFSAATVAGDVFAEPLNDRAAWQFLTGDSRRLLDAGWQVLLPSWWEAASRTKPRVRAKISAGAGGSKSGGGESLFGLNSLIDFDWRIAIGDADLTEAEFAELAARNERLVRFRGQWIPLDPRLLAQIRKAMARVDSSRGMSFQEVLQLHLLGGTEGAADRLDPLSGTDDFAGQIRLEVELNKHLNQLIRQLGQQSELPKPELPAGLRAELRPYQHEGFGWLVLLERFGLGACLADDMGLGKTVQLIAYLLHLKERQGEESGQPSLIICPTSVLGNWQKELNRFAPSLRVMLHYGGRRLDGDSFREAADHADVILTSYATAALDQELLKEYAWRTICLDEAQNIKNAQTKQSSAVRSFPARHRIALTGTPIENRLSELWSIYDFISPGFLGSASAFQQHFVQAIEREHNEQRTADLQKLIKPFLLRRKKRDPHIQLDLPDKNEMKMYVNLTAEQGALYDQTVNQLMERMQKLEGIERKGAILAALTQLKQLCDHPVLMTKEPIPSPEDSSKDGKDLEALISRSSKLERLLEMVKELREEGEQCLIFTQYVGMGQMMQRVLEQVLQEPVLYLNGSTPKSARDKMIEQFQTPIDTGRAKAGTKKPCVFVLSLKAGGVGLNLTAANHVFHFDRWWNPAVENQATDRAYRIGQTRDVQVHKFISLGTLEERIDEMLESKQQLSDNVIASSEGWITELSTEELRDLFSLRKEWVGQD